MKTASPVSVHVGKIVFLALFATIFLLLFPWHVPDFEDIYDSVSSGPAGMSASSFVCSLIFQPGVPIRVRRWQRQSMKYCRSYHGKTFIASHVYLTQPHYTGFT